MKSSSAPRRYCVIFGGAGYIGMVLARQFVYEGLFDRVVLADLTPPTGELPPQIKYVSCDVRRPIGGELLLEKADVVVNLAAVHREPGHEPHEYFETNIGGARAVTDFADSVGCRNVCFVSSIAVYGPIGSGASEGTMPCPTTPYGISKYAAEFVHEGWWRQGEGRKLVICRPGVIYGPHDPGNMLRMIRAVKKGMFVFPGSPDIKKSYGYVYGLADALVFGINRDEPYLLFNYVEKETETLGELFSSIKAELGYRSRFVRLPTRALEGVAALIQLASAGRSEIHPRRVRKVATPSYIKPEKLVQLGFTFKYDFRTSLQHWRQLAPEDF